MFLQNYLNQLLEKLDGLPDSDDFYKKIKNILRVYYLGFAHIFVINLVNDKKENLNLTELKPEEQKILENAGWILPQPDNKWLVDEYIPQLKFNLLRALDTLYKTTGKDHFSKEFDDNFIKFSGVIENNNHAAEDISFQIGAITYDLKAGESMKLSENEILNIIDEFNSSYSKK